MVRLRVLDYAEARRGGGDIVGLMITAQLKGLDFIWGQIAGMLVRLGPWTVSRRQVSGQQARVVEQRNIFSLHKQDLMHI